MTHPYQIASRPAPNRPDQATAGGGGEPPAHAPPATYHNRSHPESDALIRLYYPTMPASEVAAAILRDMGHRLTRPYIVKRAWQLGLRPGKPGKPTGRPRSVWWPEMDAAVRAEYPRGDVAGLVRRLGVSEAALRSRARVLGVGRRADSDVAEAELRRPGTLR
jgi:hypothetical protein